MDPTEHQAPAEDRDSALPGPSTAAGLDSAADQAVDAAVVDVAAAARQASSSDSTAWHVGAPAAAENAATTRLATMADLDRLSADLDRIDATLAELDAK